MTYHQSCLCPPRALTLVLALGALAGWSSTAAAQLPEVVSLLRNRADSGRSASLHRDSLGERPAQGAAEAHRTEARVEERVPSASSSDAVKTANDAGDDASTAPERTLTTILPRSPGAWHQRGGPTGQLVTAFPARVESAEGGRVRLDNGAVVELSSGTAGRSASTRLAILLMHDDTCRLWIDGRRTYRCSLLQTPDGRGEEAIESSLLEVSESGKVMRLADGSYYRPRRLDWIQTSVWLAHARVVIIGESMINLDRASAGLLRVRPGW